MLLCQYALFILIVYMLLLNKTIAHPGPPVLSKLWHGVPIPQPLASVGEKLINQIKAIVLDLLLRRVFNSAIDLKLMLEIITDVRPKCVP